MATVQENPTDAAQQAEAKFVEVLRSFDYAMLVSSGAGREPRVKMEGRAP